jgi:hypothetical protein
MSRPPFASPDEAPSGRLIRSAPYFPVPDLERPLEYYDRLLGFGCDYAGGTLPEFAIVSRDGLSIMLKLVPTSGCRRTPSPIPKTGRPWIPNGRTGTLRSHGAEVQDR